MKFFIKTLSIFIYATCSIGLVHAASFIIESPQKALSNRQQIVVQVYLDGEQDSVSGFGGDFSFPEELFGIDSILTQGSVVSLWVTDPKMREERYLDGRKHVQFEGIFPGGFDGVRSAYYSGNKPGLLFSVVLIPKNKGRSTFVIDNSIIHAFSSEAETLPSPTIIKSIEVPELIPEISSLTKDLTRVENKTLNVFVTRDPLINSGAWYLLFNETQSRSSIKNVFIAESTNYNAEDLKVGEYRLETMPYVLLHQDRTKYIHVKVVYSDNTYALRTIPPVENSKSISTLSRILISVMALFAAALFYGNTFIHSIRKKI